MSERERTPEEIDKEVNEVLDTMPEYADPVVEGKKEVIPLESPDEPISKEEWDEIIKENFPEFWRTTDLVLAVVTQLLLKDVVNPFGLVLVDKPSSGKTIILNFFAGIKKLVFSIDNFTPASFVSHAANVGREVLQSIDLLPQIKDGVLLVRDLAPVFGKKDDDLMNNMALLTRVFDGEGLETSSGVHGKRGYSGTFMFVMLAATPPIRPKVWKTMTTLGSRLFFLNLHSKEKDEEVLADQLLSGSHKRKERKCQQATERLIRTLWNKYPKGIKWDKTKTPRDRIIQISRMAILLAQFRGTVSTWPVFEKDDAGNNKMTHSIPEDERPDRVNQMLYNYARSHAIENGRDYLDKSDIKAALSLVLESAPYHRTKLFKALIMCGGRMYTKQVMQALNCSKPTAHKEMEQLVILGLVTKGYRGEEDTNPAHEIRLVEKFNWLLKVKDKWPGLFKS